MWGPDGKLHDMKAMIPDRCYAGIYQATIDDCKAHGAFDVPTMGTVSNVGLMAQSAEEYGSHDKTFEIAGGRHGPCASTAAGRSSSSIAVEPGDIWRMCRTQRPADPGLGEARGEPGARNRPRGDLLARRAARLRPQRHREGARVPEGPRHVRPRHPHPRRRSMPCARR